MKRGAIFLTLLFGVVLIRTAWLSDDALISLRTVLNVTHGFGLTYNIAERVQTFTHPLWLLALTVAYQLTGQIFYGTFAVSIVTSLAAFWVVVRGAATTLQAWLAAGLLLFSRAFVDYSTSGLENPLSHLLIAIALGVFLRPRHDGRWLTTLMLLGSLLYLTRPDDMLIVGPLLVLAAIEVRRPWTIARAVAVGAIPAVAWTLFSLVYYGFPFPNTAYAKLATGISFGERWTQGMLYVIDSIDRDPLTLVTVAVAITLAFVVRSRFTVGVAAGLSAHLLYTVSIGGDFMSGRFFAVPFLAAVVALTRTPGLAFGQWAPMYVLLGAAAISSSLWPLLSDGRVGGMEGRRSGVVDERAWYFQSKSLIHADRKTFVTPDWPTNDGVHRAPYVLDTCGLMGTGGIEWGPYAHMLDACALADPLLARLPSLWNERWRPGHFLRMVPDGYRESLQSNDNKLGDPGLAAYYAELRAVIRSPEIFSMDRLRRIGRLNRGVYDHLINRTFYRFGGEVVQLGALSEPKPTGTPRDAPGIRPIVTRLAVLCEDKPGRRYLDISVEANDAYRISFVKSGAVVGLLTIDAVPEHRRPPGLATHTLDIPPTPRARGFDTIVILPGGEDGKFAIGHLLLDGYEPTDEELARRVGARK